MTSLQVFFARPENPTGSEVLELMKRDIQAAQHQLLVVSYSATHTALFDIIVDNSAIAQLSRPFGDLSNRQYSGRKGSTADFIRKYGIPTRERVKSPYSESDYHFTVLTEKDLVKKDDRVTWDRRYPRTGKIVLVEHMGLKQSDGTWIKYEKGKHWPDMVSIDHFTGELWVPGIMDVRVLFDAEAMKATQGFEQASERTLSIIQRLLETDWDYRQGYTLLWGEDENNEDNKARIGIRLLGRAHEAPFGGRLHHKFIVIDNIVWTGSFNLTFSAERYNYENILRIDDKEIAAAFSDEFDVLWNFAGIFNEPQARFRFKCERCGKEKKGAFFWAKRLDVLEYDDPEYFLGWTDFGKIRVCEPCLDLMDQYGVGFIHASSKDKHLNSHMNNLPTGSTLQEYEALKGKYDDFINGKRSTLW